MLSKTNKGQLQELGKRVDFQLRSRHKRARKRGASELSEPTQKRLKLAMEKILSRVNTIEKGEGKTITKMSDLLSKTSMKDLGL